MNNMRTPLGAVRGLGSAKSGTHHFWLQRVTAVANIPLVIATTCLLISLVGKHHAQVTITLANPFVSLLLLLTFVSIVTHMRLGMQVIIEDYVHTEASKILLLMLNTFYCVVVGAAGVLAILKFMVGA